MSRLNSALEFHDLSITCVWRLFPSRAQWREFPPPGARRGGAPDHAVMFKQERRGSVKRAHLFASRLFRDHGQQARHVCLPVPPDRLRQARHNYRVLFRSRTRNLSSFGPEHAGNKACLRGQWPKMPPCFRRFESGGTQFPDTPGIP